MIADANYFSLLLNVGRLGTLRSLDDFKLDRISFLQSAIAVTYDCGIVDKNIRAIIAPDEAIALRIVEPFYSSSHRDCPPIAATEICRPRQWEADTHSRPRK